MDATERLGGQYSPHLHPRCTHLVVQISFCSFCPFFILMLMLSCDCFFIFVVALIKTLSSFYINAANWTSFYYCLYLLSQIYRKKHLNLTIQPFFFPNSNSIPFSYKLPTNIFSNIIYPNNT